jgi:hypothetical protein
MPDVTNLYYPGEAFIGYRAQLLVGQGGSPELFAAVADVNQITPGDMTTNVVPKTHLRSPDAHHEKLAALRDSGPFGVEGNWRPRHGSQSNAGGDGFTNGGLVRMWRERREANFKLLVPIGIPGAAIAVTTLVQAAGVATCTTSAPHDLTTGDVVEVAGAAEVDYNGSKVVTVTSPTAFTYPVPIGTASPATGTMTVTATEDLEWPFTGVVTKFQPGALALEEKTGFTAEITPLRAFDAALP